MKDITGFRYTPQPRGLNEAEVDEFKLKYHAGCWIPCVYMGTDVVWAAAGTEDDTWYRLYNRGTNDLVVLKFKPSIGKWEKSDIKDISNLYGFLWKMTLEMGSCKRELRESKNAHKFVTEEVPLELVNKEDER